MKKLIPQKIKNIYHLFQAILANLVYSFPACNAMRSIVNRSSKEIKIIGVTGTNGKTTTTQMIKTILEETGFKVAVASSLNFKIGNKEWINETKFTTLSGFQIQKFIKTAMEEKCQYLVLEISSHALDQHRVWGIKFDTAVITNITREHLDYHKTMKRYRQTKKKLFKNVSRVVVNLDMENPEEFLKYKNKEKYGYKISDQGQKNESQELDKKIKVSIARQHESSELIEV